MEHTLREAIVSLQERGKEREYTNIKYVNILNRSVSSFGRLQSIHILNNLDVAS